jgi:hypothetical protein
VIFCGLIIFVRLLREIFKIRITAMHDVIDKLKTNHYTKAMINTQKTTDGFAAFIKGFSSAFDISGRSFIEMPDIASGFEQDGAALRGDWQCVGSDMRKVMNQPVNER